ncbi:MAG: hypothetical protein ACQER7_08665 [Bacteroidota bacterium]
MNNLVNHYFNKSPKDNNDLNRPSGNILNAGKRRGPGFTRISVSAFLVVCSIFLLVISFGCQRNEGASTLKAGSAKVEITPPVGYPSYRGESTGEGTPLYAKALVFKQGKSHGALLICDVLTIPRDLSRIVRERVSKQTGIPFEHISITATHTHAGPAFRDAIEDYADRRANGELTEEDRESYVTDLIRGMTETIVTANEQIREVELTAGIGHESGVSFNRRRLMTNGKVAWNPGFQNPKLVRPAGPIDPDVHFVMFKPTDKEKFSACLTVFANHTDTRGGTEFHADYPFFLQKNLKEIFNEELVSVFGNGTCGELNHHDFTAPRPSEKKTEMIGVKLAEAIQKAFPERKQLTPDLKILSRTIYPALQGFTEEEYQWTRDENADPLYNERAFLEERRRNKILDLEQMRGNEAVTPVVSGDPWRLPVEIHVFRLDAETAIVTLPGEISVELGLDLKERSPFDNTMVIELANIDIHYVPTKRQYREGEYEPMNSRLAPGSGEKMVEEALQMLKDFE